MHTKKHKRLLLSFGIPFCVLLILISAFFIYTAHDYHADDTALALLQTSEHLQVNEDFIVLTPESESETALIFYPGGKVEYTAYLPLLEGLRQNGITCMLVSMPFNYSIFNTKAALDIFPAFPEIEHWYIGGHSLGGISANIFATEHAQSIEGLILLGSYLYTDYPPQNTLTVYGSLEDGIANSLTYTENIVVLNGGNHAQFGNYGPQRGDAIATITAEEQQNATVQAITEFLRV